MPISRNGASPTSTPASRVERPPPRRASSRSWSAAKADALAKVQQYLAPFASNVFHVGSTGAGHVTKLLNNFLNAIALSATAEVMVAGKKAGLDLAVLLDVLNKSSGVNFATHEPVPQDHHRRLSQGRPDEHPDAQGRRALHRADRRARGRRSQRAGPARRLRARRQLGYADEISNTVVDAIGDISGGVRLHDGRTDS